MEPRRPIGQGTLKAGDSDWVPVIEDFDRLTVDRNPEIIRCNATKRAGYAFKDTRLGVAHGLDAPLIRRKGGMKGLSGSSCHPKHSRIGF